MLMGSRWKCVSAITLALLVAGCASPQGVMLPPGTLMLGEVMHVLTREMANASEIAPGQKQENLNHLLRSSGLTDTQVDQGRVVVVRYRIYWHNTVSGNKYSQLSPAQVADGLAVEPGSVVELRVDERGGVIQRVRARSLADGGCYYGDVPVGAAVEAMGALSLVGPRGSASLYCSGIEKEGWQRPRTYWHKLSGSVTEPLAAPNAAPPTPVSTELTPERAVSADGMARLTIYLRPVRTALPFFHELPVTVDGEKVASLDQGTCDVVLLPAGNHVVAAGRAERTFLRNYARRELSISVSAGGHVVVEYAVDNEALVKSEQMFEFLRPEKWAPQIYHLTQRPGTSSDACAIRHPPKVLGAQALTGPEKQP
jgi:hypothetical protein